MPVGGEAIVGFVIALIFGVSFIYLIFSLYVSYMHWKYCKKIRGLDNTILLWFAVTHQIVMSDYFIPEEGISIFNIGIPKNFVKYWWLASAIILGYTSLNQNYWFVLLLKLIGVYFKSEYYSRFFAEANNSSIKKEKFLSIICGLCPFIAALRLTFNWRRYKNEKEEYFTEV